MNKYSLRRQILSSLLASKPITTNYYLTPVEHPSAAPHGSRQHNSMRFACKDPKKAPTIAEPQTPSCRPWLVESDHWAGEIRLESWPVAARLNRWDPLVADEGTWKLSCLPWVIWFPCEKGNTCGNCSMVWVYSSFCGGPTRTLLRQTRLSKCFRIFWDA